MQSEWKMGISIFFWNGKVDQKPSPTSIGQDPPTIFKPRTFETPPWSVDWGVVSSESSRQLNHSRKYCQALCIV